MLNQAVSQDPLHLSLSQECTLAGAAGIEVVVVTKTDRAGRARSDKRRPPCTRRSSSPGLYLLSAETGKGAEKLWCALKAWREARNRGWRFLKLAGLGLRV